MTTIKSTSPTFGDFLKSINFDKNNLVVDGTELENYSAFLINRTMSYFPDTLGLAGQITKFGHSIPKEIHYLFWLESAKKRKRFTKWHKAPKQKNIEMIVKLYKVNSRRAAEYLGCMTEAQIKELSLIYEDMKD